MKNLKSLFIVSYSLAGFASVGPSHEIAKVIVLSQTCGEIHQKLSRLVSYSNPDPGKSWLKKAYLKNHKAYKTQLTAVRTSPSVQTLSNLGLLNPSQAEALISLCASKIISAKTAVQDFRSYSASESLSIVKLEQQNRYILNIQSKKSEITLDLDKHLQNMADARNFNILVGQDTFETTRVGKILSKNFNEWGFIFNDEWSSQVVKVVGKRQYKQFSIQLSNGTKALLKEDAFLSALTALQHDFSSKVVQQKVLGHDRFEVLAQPLTKSQIASAAPMNRYYVKVKIQNSSFNFNFDENMGNLSTINEIEIEVPKSIYENKSAIFSPSLDWASLIIEDRATITSGKIVKKTIAADPRWVEIKLVDGQVMVISKQAFDQLP
ncbi:MAG: hypothetical protein B7Y39_04745 [Bdellovibrio sp. 28-41-41]|nr:MAG: hypothetical protein B7Y39_04745 [Bdellovibrio sp. 28-41-41]